MIDEPENRIMTAFKESHLGSELAVTKIECTSKSVTAYTLSCFFPPSLSLSPFYQRVSKSIVCNPHILVALSISLFPCYSSISDRFP